MCADLLIDVIQTIAILGTFAWLVIDYKLKMRERGHQAYVQTASNYVELEKMMLEYEDLEHIYDENPPDYTDEQRRRIFHWYYIFFMTLEMAHHAWEKKWMHKDEWDGWENTIRDLKGDPAFIKAWEDSGSHYSTRFVKYMIEEHRLPEPHKPET